MTRRTAKAAAPKAEPKAAAKPRAAAKPKEPAAPVVTAPEASPPPVELPEVSVVQPNTVAAHVDRGPEPTTPPPAEDQSEAIIAEAARIAAAREEARLATIPPPVADVKPELPFGQEPDDLAEDAESDDTITAQSPAGASALYKGLRGDNRFPEVAITVIVPEPPKGYEDLVTSGRTYTLHLNKAAWVEAEHAKWLEGHPAYDIEVTAS